MVGKGDVPCGGDPAGAERKVLNEALSSCKLLRMDDTSALTATSSADLPNRQHEIAVTATANVRNIQTRQTESATDHLQRRYVPYRACSKPHLTTLSPSRRHRLRPRGIRAPRHPQRVDPTNPRPPCRLLFLSGRWGSPIRLQSRNAANLCQHAQRKRLYTPAAGWMHLVEAPC